MSKSRKKTTKPRLADKADRHRLYELSVQCPEAEIDFVVRVLRKSILAATDDLKADGFLDA